MEFSKAIDHLIFRFGKQDDNRPYLPKQILIHLPWIEKNEEWGAYCFGWDFRFRAIKGNWPAKGDHVIFRYWAWLCFEYRDFRALGGM